MTYLSRSVRLPMLLFRIWDSRYRVALCSDHQTDADYEDNAPQPINRRYICGEAFSRITLERLWQYHIPIHCYALEICLPCMPIDPCNKLCYRTCRGDAQYTRCISWHMQLVNTMLEMAACKEFCSWCLRFGLLCVQLLRCSFQASGCITACTAWIAGTDNKSCGTRITRVTRGLFGSHLEEFQQASNLEGFM